MSKENEKIIRDFARAIIAYGCGSSHVAKLFTEWNKIVGYDMLSTASLIGRGTIANRRRMTRRESKFYGWFFKHKSVRPGLWRIDW